MFHLIALCFLVVSWADRGVQQRLQPGLLELGAMQPAAAAAGGSTQGASLTGVATSIVHGGSYYLSPDPYSQSNPLNYLNVNTAGTTGCGNPTTDRAVTAQLAASAPPQKWTLLNANGATSCIAYGNPFYIQSVSTGLYLDVCGAGTCVTKPSTVNTYLVQASSSRTRDGLSGTWVAVSDTMGTSDGQCADGTFYIMSAQTNLKSIFCDGKVQVANILGAHWQVLQSAPTPAPTAAPSPPSASSFNLTSCTTVSCYSSGRACTSGNTCCSGVCQGGSCSCASGSQACSDDRQCCSGPCTNGACSSAAVAGSACTQDNQCQSRSCVAGLCDDGTAIVLVGCPSGKRAVSGGGKCSAGYSLTRSVLYNDGANNKWGVACQAAGRGLEAFALCC